jgi:hypothetical protein
MYYGTGGTLDEMKMPDLTGVKERVWCNATTTSNKEISNNAGICLTEEQCKARYTALKNTGDVLC